MKVSKPSARDVGISRRTQVVQLVKVDLWNAHFNEAIMKFTIVHVVVPEVESVDEMGISLTKMIQAPYRHDFKALILVFKNQI